jgi:hypothetical protein
MIIVMGDFRIAVITFLLSSSPSKDFYGHLKTDFYVLATGVRIVKARKILNPKLGVGIKMM